MYKYGVYHKYTTGYGDVDFEVMPMKNIYTDIFFDAMMFLNFVHYDIGI